MNWNYALEKLADAASTLTAGSGALENRVSEAFVCLADLEPLRLPELARDEFRHLMKSLEEIKTDADQKQLVAKLKPMHHKDQLEEVARSFIRLLIQVAQETRQGSESSNASANVY